MYYVGLTSVAPYVGAWIETSKEPFERMNATSHPTWVRGLKLIQILLNWVIMIVAPYVGAWIETVIGHKTDTSSWVAPYVGAWIETLRY